MGRHNTSDKKFGLKRAFGMAIGSSAVALAALFSGHGVAGATPDGELPDLVDIFGQSAMRTSQYADPIQGNWNAMLQQQQLDLQDPANVDAYNHFIAQLDGVKGASVDQIAAAVNQLVYQRIQPKPIQSTGLSAPIETALSGYGTEQDIAALEEDLMRRLGVPDSQMLVVRLNSQGNAAAGTDFTGVLVNKGSADAPQFLIMSDFPQVIPADNDVVERTWIVRHGSTTRFALVDARNQRGDFFAPKGPRLG